MYFCKTFLSNSYLISGTIVTLHDMELNLVSSSQKKPSTLKLFRLFESLRKRLSRNRSLRYKEVTGDLSLMRNRCILFFFQLQPRMRRL